MGAQFSARSLHDLIRKAFFLLAAVLLASTFGSAYAQSSAPPTPLGRQLDKIDLSLTGVELLTSKVTGTVATNLLAPNAGESITQFASSTTGLLATIHYPIKPYFGLEMNYGYGRYTENYQGPGVANFLPANTTNFQVQTKVTEYTLGYLATPPHLIFGMQPILSVGAGTLAFKPTAFGGQEEPEKARMTYYYSLGLHKELNPHFGFQLGFRQLFYLAPDFGQNYLTILKHTTTSEPMIGFYLKY